MCNGQEPIDVEPLLFSVSGSGFSCDDWPTTGARSWLEPGACESSETADRTRWTHWYSHLSPRTRLHNLPLANELTPPPLDAVSLAGTDVLAFGVVLKGLLLFRPLRLHSKYGPLLLMVGKMVFDMLLWVVLSFVPIVAFAAALHIIYKDRYEYQTAALIDDNCNYNPDEAFESYSKSIILMLEGAQSDLEQRVGPHGQYVLTKRQY